MKISFFGVKFSLRSNKFRGKKKTLGEGCWGGGGREKERE
jgi:hypothetical protein